MKSKYKIFLNVLLVILLIVVLGILGYMSYDYISNYIITKQAEEAVNMFEQEINNNNSGPIIVDIGNEENVPNNEVIENNNNNNTNTNTNKVKINYKGNTIIGSIQIPKTKIRYPVVDSLKGLSLAVVNIYGPGLNEVRKYSISCT